MVSRYKTLLAIVLCVIATAAWKSAAKPTVRSTDVLVYGGTPAGIVAAIAAKTEGLSVILIEPTSHLGGMMTGGLGASDVCRSHTIGGLSREFFNKIGNKYGSKRAWRFEPHVAKEVFAEWIASVGLEVITKQRLARVQKSSSQITSVLTTEGMEISAKIFIDASYEADLMAQANVSYTLGREPGSQYGESFAGVYPPGGPRKHNWGRKISARYDDGTPLPYVSDEPLAEAGSGDKKIPAYNFRFCLTQDPANMVPITKPKNYDPKKYDLLGRYVEQMHHFRLEYMLGFLEIPGKKRDINTRSSFSTDFIGQNWTYPDGDWDERDKIWNEHKDYTKGLLYFLTSDELVPVGIREEMKRWGYAKDEFAETDHWPPQLYVREARRMVGEYVLTQNDLTHERKKEDSIGLATCPIESHHVQRVITADGHPFNEGYIHEEINPYEIPYRSIVPKRKDATNLLVPVAVSASHIAYSSLRMEPVYMILGHSAGVAASMAIKNSVPVQDIDIAAFREKLIAQKQYLSDPKRRRRTC